MDNKSFTDIDINEVSNEKLDFDNSDEDKLAVDVRNLNFEYNKNVHILNNVSLQIPEGLLFNLLIILN